MRAPAGGDDHLAALTQRPQPHRRGPHPLEIVADRPHPGGRHVVAQCRLVSGDPDQTKPRAGHHRGRHRVGVGIVAATGAGPRRAEFDAHVDRAVRAGGGQRSRSSTAPRAPNPPSRPTRNPGRRPVRRPARPGRRRRPVRWPARTSRTPNARKVRTWLIVAAVTAHAPASNCRATSCGSHVGLAVRGQLHTVAGAPAGHRGQVVLQRVRPAARTPVPAGPHRKGRVARRGSRPPCGPSTPPAGPCNASRPAGRPGLPPHRG